MAMIRVAMAVSMDLTIGVIVPFIHHFKLVLNHVGHLSVYKSLCLLSLEDSDWDQINQLL